MRHHSGVPIIEDELGHEGLGPLDEQTHRLELHGPLSAELVVRRQRQRRHAPDSFTREAQRLPTGRQDPQLAAGLQEEIGKFGTGVDQVLAVVEDQHKPLRSQDVRHHHLRRPIGLLRDPKRRRDRLGEQIWIREGRQFDERHARCVALLDFRCYLHGEARLANPTRPGQGE